MDDADFPLADANFLGDTDFLSDTGSFRDTDSFILAGSFSGDSKGREEAVSLASAGKEASPSRFAWK